MHEEQDRNSPFLPSDNFRYPVRLYACVCTFGDSTPPWSAGCSWATLYVHTPGRTRCRQSAVAWRCRAGRTPGGLRRRNAAERRAELRTEHPSDRYSNGGVVRPSSSGARVRTSHKMALPEKRRPGQNTAAHGRKDHVESVRVAPPTIAPASTVAVKTHSGVGARGKGWNVECRGRAWREPDSGSDPPVSRAREKKRNSLRSPSEFTWLRLVKPWSALVRGRTRGARVRHFRNEPPSCRGRGRAVEMRRRDLFGVWIGLPCRRGRFARGTNVCTVGRGGWTRVNAGVRRWKLTRPIAAICRPAKLECGNCTRGCMMSLTCFQAPRCCGVSSV